jgi:protein-L-isoaspartate(D-aspartate) O-methyltransferase
MTQDENRKQLVELLKESIKNPAVLNAFATVPRHLFVLEEFQAEAYENHPLPIGKQQTISQPYIVVHMTELLLGGKLKLKKILEVGTGSGYQAAILSQLADDVFTFERIKTLLTSAQHIFKTLKLNNIHTLYGDGQLGWAAHVPYDGIIVTAATSEIPSILLEQLADNGRLVIPVGESRYQQMLQVITRHGDRYDTSYFDAVVFVPLLPGKTD